MDLSSLKPAAGSRKKRKRVGRGPGSGHGKTSTRGHKGQRSRSGGMRSIQPWMQGGQMPLHLLIPKRGFRNIFKQKFQIINLFSLEGCPADEPITAEVLKKHGKIKSLNIPVKLLGQGKIEKPLTVKITACSKTAREKVEAAGGKVEEV
ncbi:MAG: 50S ribosomal protein L15 [FCB group bacterium]|nr:50S ribosomal protein L15 [FCB group bacterium]